MTSFAAAPLIVAFLSLPLLFALPLAASEPKPPAEAAGTVPTEFEKHYLVLLVRPEAPAEVDEARARELQTEHLAHLNRLWVDGQAVIAGPFEVPETERLRGLVLFRGDLELDEVRSLAESDPAVRAGRLEVQILPWWHGAGLMEFAPSPAPAARDEVEND